MSDEQKMLKAMLKRYPSRFNLLGEQILQHSLSSQPCDITFRDREPILSVKISNKITLALMYGAGPDKLKEMLENIPLSNGDTVSINDIWVIFPMPKGGIPQEELDAVDLAEGDKEAGSQGETVREMIREVYHCKSKEDEDRFLRRYIAS
jgi:hypothetical protein